MITIVSIAFIYLEQKLHDNDHYCMIMITIVSIVFIYLEQKLN